MHKAFFGHITSAQLHYFSDASESGSGTVTYLRMQNENKINVAFMLGKARVAPFKPVTIPCLELTAAVLGVKVDKMLQTELQLELDKSNFWTDSTSVLKYIKNEDEVPNICCKQSVHIEEASYISRSRYIPTAQNPAGAASRGLKVEYFLCHQK